VSERCSAVLAEVHRTILGELRRVRGESSAPLSLLDVGCWDGAATVPYRDLLGGPAAGIEVFPGPAARARAAGIEVAELDLEEDPFPWAEGTFDVVVVNQVFEHLKNIWLAMSEVARVLRPGGTLVFSVPNLASLHNRMFLALGLQPSSIRTFGPHVRGYSFGEARRFVEYGGFFAVVRGRGVGFYPLPARAARLPAAIWPAGSHTMLLVARRTAALGSSPPWARVKAEAGGEQTYYSRSAATVDSRPVVDAS
jgi:SAM-dependent methyltransferase